MYEIRQLEIPASFRDLYVRNGRVTERREFVEARFEACEDLAHGVAGFCSTLAFKEQQLDEAAVLQRCHAGLIATPATVSPREAAWVVCRAAEVLDWNQPVLLPPPEG